MEIDGNYEGMSCFKIPYKILRNLNISYDTLNSVIALWSKHQVFVYKDANSMNSPFILQPEFEIEKVLIRSNYVLCLDCSDNINITDNINKTDNINITIFSICKQNVKTCEVLNDKYVISLQVEGHKTLVFINNFDMKFGSVSEFEVTFEEETPNQIKYITACDIKPEHLKKLKNLFNVTYDPKYLLVISLDKEKVYACLLGETDSRPILWTNIYKSHTEIVGIEIIISNEVCIVVGLAGGNIIKIPLLNTHWKPQSYHVNTALYKFRIMENTAIYTDGITMWKNQNIFSKSNIEQFKVNNVRDFCIFKEQIICITFSNLIYSFNIDHRSCYRNSPANDYCNARDITNSESYVTKIMKLVEENEELNRKINKETEYLTAISLSNRQDIMDSLIQVSASVFDHYDDVTQESTDLTLTDELNCYYDAQSYYFLIKLSVSNIQHKLNKLLSEVLGDIKLHITLFAHQVSKTTSIAIKEQLNTTNFVIPLKRSNGNISKVKIHVKIITNIPGKMDDNQRQWTILYRKCIVLNAENFINTTNIKNCIRLKEDEDPLQTLICKKANYLHGTLHKFNLSNDQNEWSSYIKLPKNFMHTKLNQILPIYRNKLGCKKMDTLCLNLGHFSKCKNWLELNIGKEKVILSIEENDINTHIMRISSTDMSMTLDIRNFYSNIIFSCSEDCCPGTTLVDYTFHTIVKDLQQNIENCIRNRKSKKEFASHFIQLQQVVYCLLPI